MSSRYSRGSKWPGYMNTRRNQMFQKMLLGEVHCGCLEMIVDTRQAPGGK